MRKHGMGVLVIAGCAVLLATALFTAGKEPEQAQMTTADNVHPLMDYRVEKAEKPDMEQLGMLEDTSVYQADDETSVVTFYVTVRRGDAGTDTDHSFAEVYNAVRFVNEEHVTNNVFARAMVQVGDENGPMPGQFGYSVTKPNATIRIRGNSSSLYPQKSLKLTLDDDAGLWRGQSNISLVKSQNESSRMRNKLYFDLLKTVPDVPSLRTQFVHLYLKDETAGETAFADYGLFTQTEVPSVKYLKNHGFDSAGYLYKAVEFNFELETDIGTLLDFDDPAFDPEVYGQMLKCKGREDNARLIELVEKINDRSTDINDIVGPYIDRENYLTWLAYNILMDNTDTTVQNFYLYSPLNSPKWYFIPWDGDAMLLWGEQEKADSLKNRYANEYGIANYWGIVLHERFLKNAANRKALEAKVDELHAVINRETVNAAAQKYDAVVRPYLTVYPDALYLGMTLNERDALLTQLGDEVEHAYQRFQDSLDDLMPFFLYVPEQSGEKVLLTWGDAYDFANEEIRYRVVVSAYPDLHDPVVNVSDLLSAKYDTDTSVLTAGTWYWQVTAYTPSGKQTLPMNKIRVLEDYYPGVDLFEVKP